MLSTLHIFRDSVSVGRQYVQVMRKQQWQQFIFRLLKDIELIFEFWINSVCVYLYALKW